MLFWRSRKHLFDTATLLSQRIGSIKPGQCLSGKVTIETDTILIHADQADYNENAGEILAHGDVRIKLK